METILLIIIVIWNIGQSFQVKHLTRDVNWNEDCYDHLSGEMMRNSTRISQLEDLSLSLPLHNTKKNDKKI